MECKADKKFLLTAKDTKFSGRNMTGISGIEEKIYCEPKSNRRPHILSKVHQGKMRELPF